MSVEAFMVVFIVGTALVAFWIAARFPDFGPQSIVGAAVTVVAALALGEFVGPAMVLTRELPLGEPTLSSLFFGAFPILLFALVSFAWLIRATNAVLARHRI